MIIGFDISQTGSNKSGCGYYADSLLKSISKIDRSNKIISYPIFGDSYMDPAWRKNTLKLSKVTRAGAPEGHYAKPSCWDHGFQFVDKSLGYPDIIHSNNFFCPTNVKKAKLVYTLYDLSFIENPDWTTDANHQICMQGVFNASVYADHIIAISNFSRDHFLKVFSYYPENKISVIHLGSKLELFSNEQFPKRFPSDIQAGDFILSVGTVEPRKNLDRLLKSYQIYSEKSPNPKPLVIAGGAGWKMDHFISRISEINSKNLIHWLGYVSDEELNWLYRNSKFLAYPSLFEGFGLPVLESLSAGIPVLTSTTSSLPEVAGDAGIQVNPHSVDEICEGLLKMESFEFYNRTKAKAIEQAKKFSWEKTAKLTLQVYEKLLNSKP